MRSKVFVAFLLFIMGSLRPGEAIPTNDICHAVMSAIEPLNHANRSFTFRCRPGDDCGGIGDRLAGVMGGAFYAMMTGRTYRMEWPGWGRVFSPGWMNWTFDSHALGIPYYDSDGKELDPKRIRAVEGNEIYETWKGNPNVGTVNDLNTRQILEPDKIGVIETFQHVFFHSNRGPDTLMYRNISHKYGWNKDSDHDYAETYRCVFEGLFRPTQEFMSSSYQAIGQDPVPFHHIIKAVEDPEGVSMAVHYRVGDDAAVVDAHNEIIDDEMLERIVTLANKYRQPGKHMTLFFVTNSNSSAHKVLQNTAIQAAFKATYSQELTATIHVNSNFGKGSHEVEEAVQSTMQAMRDWWVMRQSDILICQLSGFCKSAALVAPEEQIRYEDAGRSPRAWYWVMCGGRFC